MALADLEDMRTEAAHGPFPLEDRLLVCVNEAPIRTRLVRTAKRMADRMQIPWIAVNVQTPQHDRLPEAVQDQVQDALRLTRSLGGEALTVHADADVAGKLLTIARSRNVSRILLGRPRRHRALKWWQEHVAQDVIKRAGPLEVTIVAPEEAIEDYHLLGRNRSTPSKAWQPFAWAGLLVALAAGVAAVVEWHLPLPNISLIFLLAVLLVAVRSGLWPSVFTSLISFLAYNFFFLSPHLTFKVARKDDVFTILLFLLVAVIVGNLAGRLKAQVEAMRRATRQTANLYDFSRRIAGAASLDDVLWAAVHHVACTMQRDSLVRSLVLLPKDGQLDIASGYPPEDHLAAAAWNAAHWAWEHKQPAGWSSDIPSKSEWLFLPLKTRRGPIGLLGVAMEEPEQALTEEQRRLLNAVADQIAVAIERTNLASDIEDARLLTETERLRSALLSSVSHDLRTPLASIIGSATSLANGEIRFSESDRAQLVQTILDEAERLNRFVQNLLDMTRLGYGALQPCRDWVDLRDIAGQAIKQMAKGLKGLKLEVIFPDGLPLLHVDPVLIENALVNILDNAVKHSPQDGRIAIVAAAIGNEVRVRVTDEGPGIPADAEESVFDHFYQVRAGDQQIAGVGLGLSICRGMIEAHGGRISAGAGPGGRGTTIAFWLPAPAHPGLDDDGDDQLPANGIAT